MGWQETNVSRKWLLKWAGFAKLVRQQVGGLYGGEPVKQWTEIEPNSKGEMCEIKYVTLKRAQYMTCGITGLPDYTGYKTKVITPDMVGKKVAIYTGVEFKNGEEGVVSKEQKAVIKMIRNDGGIAFVVRNEDTRPCDWEPIE
jgi:hypothetical protein